jgi:uncharacterized protein
MKALLRAYGALIFAITTLALTFAAYLLPLPVESKPLLFPIIVAFIPTLVALPLAALEGDGALGVLLRTLRVSRWRWVLIGALIGVGLQVAITIAALALGMISTVSLNTSPVILILAPLTLLFALGEEIGWRGYAVRKLLDGGHSPLFATILTAIPWALLHLSLFLPGMMFVGRPIVPQIASVAAFAFLHTWIFARAGKSVIATMVMHGLFNAMGALFNSTLAADQATMIGASVLVASAVIIFAASPRWWLSGQNPYPLPSE